MAVSAPRLRYIFARLRRYSPAEPKPARSVRKPANIFFSVEEQPPLWLAIIAAVQLTSVTSVTAIYPALLGQEAGLQRAAITSMIGMSFIAMAAATSLQALRPGIVGSGYLLPANFSSAYLPASLLALRAGGLSLVFGMTCVSGVATSLFARVLPRLRAIFPPEVAGLVVLLLALAVGGSAPSSA